MKELYNKWNQEMPGPLNSFGKPKKKKKWKKQYLLDSFNTMYIERKLNLKQLQLLSINRVLQGDVNVPIYGSATIEKEVKITLKILFVIII